MSQRKAHPATAILFVAYYAVAVLVVVNLVTAQGAKLKFGLLCPLCCRPAFDMIEILADPGYLRLMIEFYRASLAENVERCEARRSEITRQVQEMGGKLNAKHPNAKIGETESIVLLPPSAIEAGFAQRNGGC